MSTRWTSMQEQAIVERSAEIAVSAAAGSGKTSVLVERVARAAAGESGAVLPLDRLLIVTFTRAAAAELRSRLYKALRERLRSAAQSGNGDISMLRERLSELGLAQISTIDGFCMEVVRRYGYSAGISESRMLSESEAQLVRHELATRFLDRALGLGDERVQQLALAWGGSDGIGPSDLAGQRVSSGLRQPLLRLFDFSRTLVDKERWYRGFAERARLDPDNFDAQAPIVLQLEAELNEWTAKVL
jgi:ATP-dependent helicase/nuclease subunit A